MKHKKITGKRKSIWYNRGRVRKCKKARMDYADTSSSKSVINKSLNEYSPTSGGILIPNKYVAPVKPNKLEKGLIEANSQILKMLDKFSHTSKHAFVIADIELTASFSADGKFMGIGVGSSTQIKIKFIPDLKK